MDIIRYPSQTYKKHTITPVLATRDGIGIGSFWIVDDNLKMGFQSGKDARAFINGMRPRWRPKDLS